MPQVYLRQHLYLWLLQTYGFEESVGELVNRVIEEYIKKEEEGD